VNTELTLADLNRYAKEAGLDGTAVVRITRDITCPVAVPAVYIENGTIYLA
jgi:hypothetical protein